MIRAALTKSLSVRSTEPPFAQLLFCQTVGARRSPAAWDQRGGFKDILVWILAEAEALACPAC